LNLSVFRSEFEDFQNASFLGLSFLVRNAEKVVSPPQKPVMMSNRHSGAIAEYRAKKAIASPTT
jgi:hypothetical protein